VKNNGTKVTNGQDNKLNCLSPFLFPTIETASQNTDKSAEPKHSDKRSNALEHLNIGDTYSPGTSETGAEMKKAEKETQLDWKHFNACTSAKNPK
jgi:hypothetical protein